jgi:hypothetical protein
MADSVPLLDYQVQAFGFPEAAPGCGVPWVGERWDSARPSRGILPQPPGPRLRTSTKEAIALLTILANDILPWARRICVAAVADSFLGLPGDRERNATCYRYDPFR